MAYYLKALIVSFCLLLVGCEEFNQNFFLEEAFKFDLLELSKEYPIKKENGLLIVERVEYKSPLYRKAFPSVPSKSEGYFPVYHLKEEIGDFSWGEAYYLNWQDFEGNVQMTVYYPKVKKLLFGYFSGSGG